MTIRASANNDMVLSGDLVCMSPSQVSCWQLLMIGFLSGKNKEIKGILVDRPARNSVCPLCAPLKLMSPETFRECRSIAIHFSTRVGELSRVIRPAV